MAGGDFLRAISPVSNFISPKRSSSPKSSSAGSNIKTSNIAGHTLAQIPNLSTEQMGLFNMLFGGSQKGLGSGEGQGGGLDYLSRLAGGDEELFGQMEAPAYSSFNRTMGDIASRFSGAGARSSSAFQNVAAGEASNLAERLASNRMNLQRSAIDQLLGLSQNLLQTPLNENILVKKPPSAWEQFLTSLGGGLGQAAGTVGAAFI